MTFSKGDIVQLKSGGPAMTVDGNSGNGKIYVKWFAGAKMEMANVDQDSLKAYEAPEKK